MNRNPRLRHPDPLVATPQADGVNFSVYADHADALDLLLFDSAETAAPAQVLRLDRRGHHTAGFWHAFVAGWAMVRRERYFVLLRRLVTMPSVQVGRRR